MLAACWRMNARQEGPLRRSAGAMLCALRTLRTDASETETPSFASSPRSADDPSVSSRVRGARSALRGPDRSAAVPDAESKDPPALASQHPELMAKHDTRMSRRDHPALRDELLPTVRRKSAVAIRPRRTCRCSARRRAPAGMRATSVRISWPQFPSPRAAGSSERGLPPLAHITPHSLRRTYVSIMLLATDSISRSCRVRSGHAHAKMTPRRLQPVTGPQQAADTAGSLRRAPDRRPEHPLRARNAARHRRVQPTSRKGPPRDSSRPSLEPLICRDL
jgi:hypothetical protein